MSFLAFSPNFLWGTATAAHQVEGQNFNNDWWEWEQSPDKIRNGVTSRVACDWWGGRYVEDFDRAQALGTNAHRLSVEWSRIEPREGEWDDAALQTYRSMLQAIHERGMKPFVTLQHFTNPLWLAAKGGWENPAIIQHFARFARHVVGALRDLCSFWITLNEPNVYAYEGYSDGEWPPGVRDVRRAFGVMRNQVRAHAGAYYVIKDVQPSAQVGLSHHVRFFYPYHNHSPLDRLTAYLRSRIFNQLIFLALEDGHLRFPLGTGQYLPEVSGTQDFLGLNYYYTDQVIFDLAQAGEMFGRTVLNPNAIELKELFGSVGNIEVRGLESTLGEMARSRRPIYITENGVFDDGKNLQSYYLISHLSAVHRAIAAGADIRGYFWWTLTDNFEWTEGYTPRFGLYHLDLATQRRTPRPVADVYARIIREKGIGDDLIEAYGRSN